MASTTPDKRMTWLDGNLDVHTGRVVWGRVFRQQLRRWDLPIAMWLLALVSFSLPGRDGPGAAGGLDWIALSKLAVRGIALVWFGGLCLRSGLRRLRVHASNVGLSAFDYAGRFLLLGQWTSRLLLPWWCLLFWSLVTISWSALVTVSVGQWLGFAALLAMAQVIANRAGESRGAFSRVWRDIAVQLLWVLSAYCLFVLVIHLVAPNASGLDRSISVDGNNGFFHPTAVGATSSLGLLFVGTLFLRGVVVRWSLVTAMAFLHATLLFLSQSRAALAMTLVGAVFCFVCLMTWRTRSILMVAGGTLLLVWVTIDPGFELAGLGFKDAVAYVQRGQSTDQLQQVSGRAELWRAIWDQYCDAPLGGHGYFVTSSTGELDVWEGPSNQDAHNVVLQVLVTTGLVGGVLFGWALISSWMYLARQLLFSFWRQTERLDTDFCLFIAAVALWYAGWTQGCVSFLGPIRPEAVTFFALLGLLAAHQQYGELNRESGHRVAGEHVGGQG